LLGTFDGTKSFRDEFYAFVKSLSSGFRDEVTRSVLHVQHLGVDEDSVWGEVRAGDFGRGGSIFDSETMKESHRQTRTEAKLDPFTFLLHAPDAERRAVIVLQRHGSQGVQSSFTTRFREFFAARNSDHLFKLDPHVPSAVIRHLLNEGVKQVKLRTYRAPSDLTDAVKFQGDLEDLATITITARAKKGKYLPLPGVFQPEALRTILEGHRDFAEVVAAHPEDTKDITITFDYGGSQRSMNLRNPGNMAPYINIDETVETDDDGHASHESVLEAARRLLEQVRAEMVKR
jgi:hypothetical protein